MPSTPPSLFPSPLPQTKKQQSNKTKPKAQTKQNWQDKQNLAIK